MEPIWRKRSRGWRSSERLRWASLRSWWPTVEAEPNREPESGKWGSGSHDDAGISTLRLTWSVRHSAEGNLAVVIATARQGLCQNCTVHATILPSLQRVCARSNPRGSTSHLYSGAGVSLSASDGDITHPHPDCGPFSAKQYASFVGAAKRNRTSSPPAIGRLVRRCHPAFALFQHRHLGYTRLR